MPDPITIQNRGDRALLLADHAVLVATLDQNGQPVPLGGGAGGSIATTQAPNASTTAATGSQGTKAVATPNTPVRLAATSTLVETVEIIARKNLTTANTGDVYVGFSATGGQNYRVLAPGASLTLSAPNGKKIDLNTIFIDAVNAADSVTFTALN